MNAVDMTNISRNIEEIKRELYQLDVMYGKLKAQVLMNATPVYVYEKENELFRAQYSEETKHLLEEISKQHCEAIKRLAERYGIEIKDANDKEKMEAEPIKEDKYIVTTIEEAIKTMLCLMPIEHRQIACEYDCKANQQLCSQSGEATLMIDRGDGTIAENIFSYKMKETGVFKEKGQQNESDNDEY